MNNGFPNGTLPNFIPLSNSKNLLSRCRKEGMLALGGVNSPPYPLVTRNEPETNVPDMKTEPEKDPVN
jgi:hypothetical protein